MSKLFRENRTLHSERKIVNYHANIIYITKEENVTLFQCKKQIVLNAYIIPENEEMRLCFLLLEANYKRKRDRSTNCSEKHLVASNNLDIYFR